MEHYQQQLRAQLKNILSKLGRWKAIGLSEPDTKTLLIEPVLAILGWDTTDPDEVRREHSAIAGRVDYALRIEGRTIMFVEAKSLHAGLVAGRDAKQLVSYGATEGIRWGLLTDGVRYELYDNFNNGPLAQKCVFSCSIDQLPDDSDTSGWQSVVSKFSLLRRESVAGPNMGQHAAELKGREEKEREREKERYVSPLSLKDLQGEEEIWQRVRSSSLESMYRILRSRIRERMPELRAEKKSGGPGWVKFRKRLDKPHDSFVTLISTSKYERGEF